MTFLKSGRNKVPLDRVPSLAKALEVDPAYLRRLALGQSDGATAAKAIVDIFGTPATDNEQGWLTELRDASDNADPRITAKSRASTPGDPSRARPEDHTDRVQALRQLLDPTAPLDAAPLDAPP